MNLMKTHLSPRALEMIMRDVLDGLEELSLHMGYHMNLNGEVRALRPVPVSRHPQNNIHLLQAKQRKSA
jgi:hypothetical protein